MIAHAVGVPARLGEGLDAAGGTPREGERDLDGSIAGSVGGGVGEGAPDHDGAEAFEFDVLAARHRPGPAAGSRCRVVVDVGEQQPRLREDEGGDMTVDRLDVDVRVDVDEVAEHRLAEEGVGEDALGELRIVSGRLEVADEDFG
ncbi:Uncharacterised protein [Mycobacteroides abscessus subsp. abscessus]|nr:Uncharacterised protein [Mycobacteroides abscessus subsp. abscessus]